METNETTDSSDHKFAIVAISDELKKIRSLPTSADVTEYAIALEARRKKAEDMEKNLAKAKGLFGIRRALSSGSQQRYEQLTARTRQQGLERIQYLTLLEALRERETEIIRNEAQGKSAKAPMPEPKGKEISRSSSAAGIQYHNVTPSRASVEPTNLQVQSQRNDLAPVPSQIAEEFRKIDALMNFDEIRDYARELQARAEKLNSKKGAKQKAVTSGLSRRLSIGSKRSVESLVQQQELHASAREQAVKKAEIEALRKRLSAREKTIIQQGDQRHFEAMARGVSYGTRAYPPMQEATQNELPRKRSQYRPTKSTAPIRADAGPVNLRMSGARSRITEDRVAETSTGNNNQRHYVHPQGQPALPLQTDAGPVDSQMRMALPTITENRVAGTSAGDNSQQHYVQSQGQPALSRKEQHMREVLSREPEAGECRPFDPLRGHDKKSDEYLNKMKDSVRIQVDNLAWKGNRNAIAIQICDWKDNLAKTRKLLEEGVDHGNDTLAVEEPQEPYTGRRNHIVKVYRLNKAQAIEAGLKERTTLLGSLQNFGKRIESLASSSGNTTKRGGGR